MSVTKSRFAPRYPVAAPSGAASGPSLAEALADHDVALIRIRSRCDARFRPYHDLVAWTASYRRVHLDQADRDALAAWYMELHPDVDWSRDHQVVVATGEVQSAPDAWEPGFIPEDDGCLGGGPAIYLSGAKFSADTELAFPVPPLVQMGAGQ